MYAANTYPVETLRDFGIGGSRMASHLYHGSGSFLLCLKRVYVFQQGLRAA